MNNKEFITELSRQLEYTQEHTQGCIRCVIDAMSMAFDNGESVSVAGFGSFEVKKRLERIIVNPSTGQRMIVPPKLVLNFKPAASIKEELKKGGLADV